MFVDCQCRRELQPVGLSEEEVKRGDGDKQGPHCACIFPWQQSWGDWHHDALGLRRRPADPPLASSCDTDESVNPFTDPPTYPPVSLDVVDTLDSPLVGVAGKSLHPGLELQDTRSTLSGIVPQGVCSNARLPTLPLISETPDSLEDCL